MPYGELLNYNFTGEKIQFEVRPELHTDYIKDKVSSTDRIDIAFTGLVKKKADFSGIPKEEIYFAFES